MTKNCDQNSQLPKNNPHDSSDEEWKKLTETDLDHHDYKQKCFHPKKTIHFVHNVLSQSCRQCEWTCIIDTKEICQLCFKQVLECSCDEFLFSPLLLSDHCSKSEFFARALHHFFSEKELKIFIIGLIQSSQECETRSVSGINN